MFTTVQSYADSLRSTFRSQKEIWLQKGYETLVPSSSKGASTRNFSTGTASYPIKAECFVGPRGKVCGGAEEQAPACIGKVSFEQAEADMCKIAWELTGCGKEGLHGFHIHEKADFSNGCESAGPHYNPFNKTHGGPDDEERHVGDLGNITVDAKGNSMGSMTDHLIKLTGPTSIIGRSVMIHADPDDLGRGDNSEPGVNGKTSKTTGNAGARIACGEVVII